MATGLKFREVSVDLLTDFLINLNKTNKDKLNNVSQCDGIFKNEKITENIFLITRILRLDLHVGFHAIELLQRFMVKHLRDLLTTLTPKGAAADHARSDEDALFDAVNKNFPVTVFSCVQLASKLSLCSQNVNNKMAVHFLHSVGQKVSLQTLFDSEMMILKGLEFRLHVPNPLTYMETLLEVLGHNEPSIRVEGLYDPSLHVLQFVSLHRIAVYVALLKMTTQSDNPSGEQREKFVTVTEDSMLLGVSVIAVASFIVHIRKFAQVVEELSHITGIAMRSIRDFAHVILMHIVGSSFPVSSA